MRVCRHCRRINGDTDETCRACGGKIDDQLVLPPSTPVPRPMPDMLARLNRRYLLALLMIPLLIGVNLIFWTQWLPGLFHQTIDLRERQLAINNMAISAALAGCKRDTGGVPSVRLELLQQFTVTSTDLTPGGHPNRWRGPYLPADRPFPPNPNHPNDGTAGWRYQTNGNEGTVRPL